MPTTYRRSLEPLGLGKLASIIEALRGQTPSLLIDNGDLIQGSPLASYYHANHLHQPNPIIDVANFLNYDVAIFGNHEFNYGLPFLKKSRYTITIPLVKWQYLSSRWHNIYATLHCQRIRRDTHCYHWYHNAFCPHMRKQVI